MRYQRHTEQASEAWEGKSERGCEGVQEGGKVEDTGREGWTSCNGGNICWKDCKEAMHSLEECWRKDGWQGERREQGEIGACVETKEATNVELGLREALTSGQELNSKLP